MIANIADTNISYKYNIVPYTCFCTILSILICISFIRCDLNWERNNVICVSNVNANVNSSNSKRSAAPALPGDSHKGVYPTPTLCNSTLHQNTTFHTCGNETGVQSDSTTGTDPKYILQELKLKCNKNVVISHINVNSIRNKFDNLRNIIAGNVDILLVSETKLDDSFPAKQFLIEGYSLPFRLDRSGRAGGLLLFVREDIPSKALKTHFSREGIFLEINLKNCKWLLFGGYNPHKDFIKDFLSEVSAQLDNFMQNYENFMLIGDFNSEITESSMIDFMNMHNLKNLISDPTCFKNPDRPTSIDVMLTNKFKSFKFSNAIETGLSDFHMMTNYCYEGTLSKN